MATILIVDDLPVNRELLVEILRHRSHRLLEASDGREALDVVRRESPDLVLTDILMPTMDGYEFVRQLRSDDATAAIPVIFTSAHYLEREARALADRCGISHILPKPLEPEAVLDTVSGVLGTAPEHTVDAARNFSDFDPEHVRLLTDKLSATEVQLHATHQRLTAVIELCGELASEHDPTHLLDSLAHAARAVVGARYAVVVALASADESSRQPVVTTHSGADAATGTRLAKAVRDTHSLHVLSLAHPVLRLPTLGVANSPEPFGPVVALAINSLTHRYGWLCLVGKVGLDDFTREDERLAMILAGQTGRIYENGKLYLDLMRRTEQLEAEVSVSTALVRAGNELIRELGASNLARKLCELDRILLEADYSFTVMLDETDQTYAFLAMCGVSAESEESLRAIRLPRRVFSRLEELLDRVDVFELALPEMTPRWRAALDRFGMRRVLCASLGSGATRSGIQIAASNRDRAPYSTVQRKIASGIAHLGSLALDNARLMRRLAEADRLKSEFVATMSHELRTPLNIIIGYNDLMRDGAFGDLGEEQNDVLGRVRTSAHQLLSLINNLLDLGRLDVGRTPLSVSDVDVTTLLDQLRSEVGDTAANPDVETIWRVPPGIPTISTDAVKLRVVLKNVLANALKFTDRGHISVSATALSEGVAFDICDTGPGIPPEAVAVIFEPFRQLEPASTRTHGGVGLGLYITRRLLDLLGGCIEVESRPGAGSCFRVVLPARAPERMRVEP